MHSTRYMAAEAPLREGSAHKGASPLSFGMPMLLVTSGVPVLIRLSVT